MDRYGKVKVKVKLCLCLIKRYAMKTYDGVDPRIFNLGTRWKWVVSFTHQPLYPEGWLMIIWRSYVKDTTNTMFRDGTSYYSSGSY
jgi:hypothetical protein